MGKYDNGPALEGLIRRAKNSLRPPPNLKPSDWAERNVKIPVGNAVPGYIRFDNAPYQRLPLDLMADPDCERITLQWAAQVGKTQLALCGQAYHIAMRPMSQMMMQPSEGDLQVWLSSKFDPMVAANESLQRVIAKPRGRNGVNNTKMKSYPGGFLMFAWAGSPRTMRGRSAPFIVADEVDGYDRVSEGHPVGLLWQRSATFGDDRKLVEISTPTIKGQSYIEAAFQAGDQRYFFVPCPGCGVRQVLSWMQVTWDGKDNPKADQYPDTAVYVCQGCGMCWNDGDRKVAIRNGEWVAQKPFRGHASFHLSELYSTFRTLRAIVKSYLEKIETNDLQTFVNVSLAQTWEEQGEQADADTLEKRCEEYRVDVPMGGVVLTAGVDMQGDRLEVEIVAWGFGEESWSIDYVVLWGDPTLGEVWEDLEDLLSRTYQHESGNVLTIQAACVDTGGTGGMTQSAYDWLRGKTGRRIFGTKGIPGWGKPIVAAPSRKQSGKNVRKIDLFQVGADEAKLAVMRRLTVKQPGPGYCHFPSDRGSEYFKQLTAERLITRYVKGFPVREWHKMRERNEALDCRVLATAALKIMNPTFKRLAAKLGVDEQRHEAAEAPAPAPVEKPQEAKREIVADTRVVKRSTKAASRPIKRSGGGWLSSY